MGCRCRGTPGMGASRRRLGCHWWGAGICFWGVVGDMPSWQKGGYRVTQRGGLRFSRCALTGVVGFWLSTGIASNGRDVETASEAGVAVVAGFVRTAGWPQEKRWRWSLAGRSAKG